MENKYTEYCDNIIENCRRLINETGNKNANLMIINSSSLNFDLLSESFDFEELKNKMLKEYKLYIITDLENLIVITEEAVDSILLKRIFDLYSPNKDSYLN